MTFTMISPQDWQRMSWHARQKYMQRNRLRLIQDSTPEPVKESVPGKPAGFNHGIIHRCRECGAWMIDVCATDHGRRYEP